MPLTDFAVVPRPEIDDAITIKADDGRERIVAEIPRILLDDYFRHRSLTGAQRQKLVESNLDAISTVISRKYEQGLWKPEPRFGSTVRCVVIEMSDLVGGPRLTDISLMVEEGAGFQRPAR